MENNNNNPIKTPEQIAAEAAGTARETVEAVAAAAAAGAAAGAAAAQTATPATPAKKPLWKRILKWGAIGGLLAAAGVGAYLYLNGEEAGGEASEGGDSGSAE